MFVTYLVVVMAYLFSAFAGWALIKAVDHLDAAEVPPTAQQPASHQPQLAA